MSSSSDTDDDEALHACSETEIRADEYLGAPLIHVRGEVDSSSVKHLHQAIDDALLSHSDVILLDLTDLVYIDSAGLNVLFDTTRAISQRGWIGVIAPNPMVLKLFKMGGLVHHPCFHVFEDVDAVRLDL